MRLRWEAVKQYLRSRGPLQPVAYPNEYDQLPVVRAYLQECRDAFAFIPQVPFYMVEAMRQLNRFMNDPNQPEQSDIRHFRATGVLV